MADIVYKSFLNDHKRSNKLEISGDYDKYGKVMKGIGARRNNSLNVWFLDVDLEWRLKNMIQKLGGNPEKQKIIESGKQITAVVPQSNAPRVTGVTGNVSNVSNVIHMNDLI